MDVGEPNGVFSRDQDGALHIGRLRGSNVYPALGDYNQGLSLLINGALHPGSRKTAHRD